MVYLTRRYHFSAGHRLHNEALSADENRRIYGKCNNPNGHGHNYLLEVTMGGRVDQSTGMIFDLAALDRTVQKEIMERFDHKNLNMDVENFRERVPTTENVCIEIFKILAAKLNGNNNFAHLDRVRLEETGSNFFEYSGGQLIGGRK
jgi:6-pyruvoyltetrahydropterin/6-carboxytetrahydropterin synthase